MLEWLTPAERRGAVLLALLVALGAVYDLWRAERPRLEPGERAAVSAAAEDDEAASALGSEPPPGGAPAPAVPTLPGPPERPLDLNRASAAELEALPGIGPVLALRIARHRDLHGRFSRIEDLLGVRGVGPRLFARLKSRVRVADGVHSAVPRPLRRADSTSVGRDTAR